MNASVPERHKILASELPEASVKDVIEAVGEVLKGEGGLSLKAVDPDGSTLEAALDKAVKDALAISSLKALIKGWKGMDQVADLIGPRGPEDGKPRHVTIASHSLKASFTPNIVVELGKVAEIRKVPVPVTFTLKVEGLIVTVTNRRILSIAAGRAKPSVTVKVDGVTVLDRKLPTIDLPLEFEPEGHDADAAQRSGAPETT